MEPVSLLKAGSVSGEARGPREGHAPVPPAPPFAPSWRHDPWGVVPRSLGRRLGRVHVGFLLGLGDVFFVADPLVAKPVIDLGEKMRLY